MDLPENLAASKPPFDRYLPYEELAGHLKRLSEEYPALVQLESLGQSFEGRDIWLLAVTDQTTGPAENKPAVWVDGNIHATEVSAASACLFLAWSLLSGYGTDADITRCLKTRAFYIAPCICPDGAELYFSDHPRFLRSSARPYPYDEEPLTGLRKEDVDGDGRILSMRVPDPNGAWKADPEEPRLLIRRDPAEAGGTYYRLLFEGMIENWDGVTIEVPGNKEGLDLNRNFPAHWRPENEQFGAGPFPTSEPEIRAMAAFIASHLNITAAITFHTFSGVLLRPYGMQSDEEMPAEDLWTFKKIGEKGTEVTGYPAISTYHEFRYHPKEVITGVFDDWMYDHFGVYSWTVELWSPQRQAGITDYKYIDWFREHPREHDRQMLQWSDEKLGGKGYVDWYPFEHPQLGRVELGGWDVQHAFRNPPPEYLEKELEPFPRWLVWHALIAPELAEHSSSVERLGPEAWRLRVVLQNAGWLPTYVSKKSKERKIGRGIVVELDLPEGATLLTGKLRELPGELEGRAYKNAAGFGWQADATDDRLKLEWTFRAAEGERVRVRARHERAGSVEVSAVLR